MATTSTPSKKMNEQPTSPDSSFSRVLGIISTIWSIPFSWGAADTSDKNYVDVKTARSLIFYDSPGNSTDNTKEESHNRSLTLHEA